MKSPIIFRVFKNNQICFVKQFLDKDQFVFGSSLDSEAELDIDLASSEVSPIHCLIEKRGLEFYLCDLGSIQGTKKNNQPILDEVIKSGDEFSVGPFKIVFFNGIPKANHIIDAPTNSIKPNVTPLPNQAQILDKPPVQTPPSQPPPPPTNSHLASDQNVKSNTSSDSELKITQVVIPISKTNETNEAPKINAAFIVQRPSQKNKKGGRRKFKGDKTFAPKSEFESLNQFIKTGKGSQIEIIVSWKERILNTYHLPARGQYKIGAGQDIQLPDGTAPKNWTLIDTQNGVVLKLNDQMKVDVHRQDQNVKINDTLYRLQQNEVVFIEFINGMVLAIRFSPQTKLLPLDSPFILSPNEFTGVLAALIFSVLLSLIVSVLSPKNNEQTEEVQRVAQVIFNLPPKPETPKVEEVRVKPPPPQEEVKPPEEPKKVVVADKKVEKQVKGQENKPQAKAQAAQSAGKAAEVKPKDSKLKTKMFTSVKQGGAIKTGDKNGANAQSKEIDPTNTGLLSAFGSGGARSKIDKAYNGSGEALGAGEKATGTSGFNSNRAGDDFGSKFKDTGAGGKGTATQGIAGVGTKGLSNGMGLSGSGLGFGSKDQVEIIPGGSEEEFVGSIDKEAVRRVVKSALASFKACYDREYRSDKKLEGKVSITWEIHEKGIPKNARVERGGTTINNRNVEECVRIRMLGLRFPEPPPGTIAEITYPFMFQGQK